MMKAPRILALALLTAAISDAYAVDLVLTAEPPGPVEVGDEVTVSLSIDGWDATDPQVDAVAFNVDFDLAVFEFVSGSGETVADGSEFLALPSQAGGYNLGDDSSEALVGFGRYIFGAADTGDGTAGSVGPIGTLGSFQLRAIAVGTGKIEATTNMPTQVFSDPDLYGIDASGGVGLGTVEVEVVEPDMTYRRWADAIAFPDEESSKPDADPDRDGRDNTLEYYLDANPLVSDRERDPRPEERVDGYATLVFERPGGAAARSDARGFGERSNDLDAWSRDDVVVESIGVIDPATGLERVVLRSTVVATDLRREFLRLAVVLSM